MAYEDKRAPAGAPIFSTYFKRSWELLESPKFEDEIVAMEQSCKDCVKKKETSKVIWVDFPGIVGKGWELSTGESPAIEAGIGG